MTRRQFLALAAALSFVPPGEATADVRRRGPARAARPGLRPPIPEHAIGLEESIVVFDAVEPDLLFQEIVAILRSFPPGARVRMLASPARADAARERIDGLATARTRGRALWNGVGAVADGRSEIPEIELLVVDDPELWSYWARDLSMIGWPRGERTLLLPYRKEARDREALAPEHDPWFALARGSGPRGALAVARAPFVFEGGNLLHDRIDGAAVLFAGHDVILDTQRVLREWFGMVRSPAQLAAELAAAFGVDRVELLGRTENGVLLPQAERTFHLDLVVTLLSGGRAVVSRLDPDPAAARQAAAEIDERHDRWDVGRTAWGAGPPDEEGRANRDPERLVREAAAEMDAVRRRLRQLGYTVHDLDTDAAHVLRHQSHTNVLLARDRVLVPTFPSTENVTARRVEGPGERGHVELVPGERPNEFALTGIERAAVDLYRRLGLAVHPIEDSFYLAGGNLHCVVGRLA